MSVTSDGELVVARVLGLTLSFEFDLALQMSIALRTEALHAKRAALIRSRSMHAFGVLHNATADREAVSRFRPQAPRPLAGRDVEIKQVGTTVAWRIGRHTLTLPFADALRVSRWLLVNGRIAQGAAGDTTDWSKIANVDAAQARERNI
jgi:hypothetical protein